MSKVRSVFILAGLLAVLLAGCGPASAVIAPVLPTATLPPTAAPTATATATPVPVCDAAQTPEFGDYAVWTLVNDHPIPGHETQVNIYVDDLSKDIYLSASGATFPTCARIVKTHLLSATSDEITAVTVMAKMPAGYDPAHNDWWWGMFTPDGKTALMSGKVSVCIDCHEDAADADYVFSSKVMDELKK